MAKVMIIGGVPRSLTNFRGPLIGALTLRGHRVVVSSGHASADIIHNLQRLGADFKPIPIERTGLNPVADLKLCLVIFRLFRLEKPDLILAYTIKPVIFGGIVARLTRMHTFYAMITGLGYALDNHQTLKQRIVGAIVRPLYRLALKKSSGVFFQNKDDEKFFRQNKLILPHTNVIQINGSGVDLKKFQPTPLPITPVFSLVARLIVDKGLREFYFAAKSLKQRYPLARFLIAGALDANPNSIKKEELKTWISEGVIEFRGWLDDIRPFLSETQVYVLPSYREGTPRSVLEAMAMGRSIITTDAPGCRETVIDGQNGFLVPPRDASALERAMERFILDTRLASRMGFESLKIVREKYDVNKVNTKIIDGMGLHTQPIAHTD